MREVGSDEEFATDPISARVHTETFNARCAVVSSFTTRACMRSYQCMGSVNVGEVRQRARKEVRLPKLQARSHTSTACTQKATTRVLLLVSVRAHEEHSVGEARRSSREGSSP